MRIRPLAFLLPVVLGLAAPSHAGGRDKIIRVSLGPFFPTSAGGGEVGGSEEFLNPAHPPMGTLDSTRLFRFEAQSDLGAGLAFEYKLTDRVGIDAGVSYTRLASEGTYAGEMTFTPYFGELPAAAPEHTETAPILGSGAGRTRLLLVTVGANIHVIQDKRWNLYLGPLVGLAIESTELEHGRYGAIFSWVTTIPVDGREETYGRPAVGGVIGVDLPLGEKGWLLSAAGKYVWTGGLNPSMLQMSIGYRF